MTDKNRPMTDAEIVAEYRQAKAPMKQIGILADQNLCSKRDIVAVLQSAGCDVPKNYQKLPKVETPEEPARPAQLLNLDNAALDAIKAMLPVEGCTSEEALNYVVKVHAILEFLEVMR